MQLKYLSDVFSALMLLGLVALIAVVLSHKSQSQFFGHVKVLDGDSIVMAGKRMRLEGIDAPEYGQTCRRDGLNFDCGRDAKKHLSKIAGGNSVECRGGVVDKYERLLVRCFVGDEEINARMVRDGWAVSFGGYGREEGEARRQKVGLWAGDFDSPQLWRQMRRAEQLEEGATPKQNWWKLW